LLPVLTRELEDQERRLRRTVVLCRKNPLSKNAVHDLRVATRRVITLLDVAALLCKTGIIARARKQLKGTRRAVGALRDLQVVAKCLGALEARHPLAGRMRKEMEARLKREQKSIRAAVNGKKIHRLIKCLDSIHEELKSLDRQTAQDKPIIAQLWKQADGAFARTLNCSRTIDPSNTKTLHRTRIAIKRFRYLCEFFALLVPGCDSQRLSKLQGFQRRLGDIQDIVVASQQIAESRTFRKLDATGKVQVTRMIAVLRRRQTDVPLSGLFFGLDFALIFCSVVLSLIYDIYACIFSLT
jgi:CHAD domain-containing protein